jgi:hypothetical protein
MLFALATTCIFCSAKIESIPTTAVKAKVGIIRVKSSARSNTRSVARRCGGVWSFFYGTRSTIFLLLLF